MNAQSLRNQKNFSLILAFLSENKVDVLSIAEAWTTPRDPDSLISIPGYKLHRNDRGLSSNNQIKEYMLGGGVACYVIDTIQSKLVYAPQIATINETEYLLLELKVPNNDPLLFASVYRRPKGFLLSQFFIDIQCYVQNYSCFIISGDLNRSINTSDYESSNLLDLISEHSLFLVPTGNSYHENNVHKWHDAIIIDDKDKLINCGKSSAPFINGHDYILAEYMLNNHAPATKKVKYRDFKNRDHESLEKSIIDTANNLMGECLHSDDVNTVLNKFRDFCHETLDTHAPYKREK